MNWIVIDCGSQKTPEIVRVLQELDVPNVQLIRQEELNGDDPDPQAVLVLSGAPILLTEVDPSPYLKRFSFLANRKLSVLGICFGHQILGMLFGAKISRCPEARSWEDIQLKAHPLLDRMSNPCSLMEDHCEHISLPPNFQLLGSSATSPVEIMAHPTEPKFGLQSHPEVSGENGKQLFQNFVSIVSKQDIG